MLNFLAWYSTLALALGVVLNTINAVGNPSGDERGTSFLRILMFSPIVYYVWLTFPH